MVDSGRGEPAVGCADDPGNGIEALTQAGFAVTEVTSFPGAVCRIDDYPEADCGPMPPAGASWSYWYAADANDEWTYAASGAGVRDPDRGEFEGWVFGDGSRPPTVAPGDAAVPTARPDAEPGAGRSLSWIAALVALAAITGLVIWRLRRDRQA
ncbi:hypothetical protein GCM10028833_11470 [Glycomyces tarimensis]